MTRESAQQQRLVAAYFDAVNEERYEDAASLFAPDGELFRVKTDRRRGADEIAAYFGAALSRYREHAETPTRQIYADTSATVEVRFVGVLDSGSHIAFDAVTVFDFDDGAIARASYWYGSENPDRRGSGPGSCAHASLKMPQFDQVGIIVANLEAAMEELGIAVQVQWTGPFESQRGGWHLRYALSTDGQFELIEAESGSPWNPSGSGSHLDHLAYFVDDLGGQQRRLIEAGLPVDIDGSHFGGRWSYHRSSFSGLRIELVDAAQRTSYFVRASGQA